MPPVVAAVAVGAATGIGAALGGVTILGLGAVASAGILAGLSFGFSLLQATVFAPEIPDFSFDRQAATSTVRATQVPRNLIFGEAIVGGQLSLFSQQQDNQFDHIVVSHSAHLVGGFRGWEVNREIVPPDSLDGSGNVIAGRFAGKLRIKSLVGAFDQAADPDLVAEVPEWTTDHKGGGVAYSYLRKERCQKCWPNGFQSLRAIVRGMPVYDPRQAGVAITSSTAASPAVFTTGVAHGRSVGDPVWIRDHSGATELIGATSVPWRQKWHQIATVPQADQFTLIDEDGVPVAFDAGGTGGTVTPMAWSDNWALCVRMYLTYRDTYNYGDDFIDDASVIASANICDEQVPLTLEAKTYTADPSSNRITLPDSVAWRLGDVVQFAGTPPAPCLAATDYYWIRETRTTGYVAASLADARADSPIDLTTAGDGTEIERQSQVRYRCNGVIRLGKDPVVGLEGLMTAAAGVVPRFGKVRGIFAGAATTPAGTLTDADLAAEDVAIERDLPREEFFNAVRGGYTDPDKFYSDVGYSYKNDTYRGEDFGQRVYKPINLPFTDDPIAAQRLGKIALERARQGITFTALCKPKKIGAGIWDVEQVTFPDFGWAAKEFRIVDLAEQQDFAVKLTYREEAAAVYDWNLGDETAIDLAPNTNLPDPFTPPDALQNFGLETGTNVLFTRLDGAVFSQIRGFWDAVANSYVTQNGRIESDYKKSADAEWIPNPAVKGTDTEFFILNVEDGVEYDVRARAVNSIGVPGPYVQVLNEEVIGKTAPPSDVPSISAQQIGDTVRIVIGLIADADRNGYWLKYAPVGEFVWDTATTLSIEQKGTSLTDVGLPPGTWTIGVKALDRSTSPARPFGNESLNATTVNVTVANLTNVTIFERFDGDRWVPGAQPTTVADLAGNNDGTIVGADVTLGNGYFGRSGFGIPGKAFPGQRIEIADILDFAGTQPYTIMAWCFCTYPITEGDSARIISKEFTSGLRNGYAIVYAPAQQRFQGTRWVNDVLVSVSMTPGVAPLNRWHHVTITYDGNNQRAYLGGALQNTGGSDTRSLPGNSELLTIGTQADNTSFGEFKGTIDDVRIYDTALSADDINGVNAYTSFQQRIVSPATEPDLVGYWTGKDEAVFGGFVRHDVSGLLIPQGRKAAAELTDAQLFEQWVQDPVADSVFQGKEVDLGFDSLGTRIFGSLTTTQRADDIGTVLKDFEVDTRKAAEAYGGFQVWSVGEADARYVKTRAVVDHTFAATNLDQFRSVFDIKDRTERAVVTVAQGGTSVVWETLFGRPFHTAPAVSPSAQSVGGDVRIGNASNVTSTGADLKVFDDTNTDVGGTVDLIVIGP